MCSDGIWLYGRSNANSASNIAPNRPSAAGRSNENRCGAATKHATAKSCVVSKRCACASSSRRDAQTKSDSPYSASIDQYGTIVHAQNGIARSQPNASAGTTARCAAVQFAKP